MSYRAKVLMVITLAVLTAGFFYLRVLARRVFFEPAPHGEEEAHTRLSEVALQSARGLSQTVTLYFPSYDEGLLLAENRQMAGAVSDTDRIRQILLALIEGSHQGHSRALPPSTDIRAVFLTADGTAYLDFANDLLTGLAPGIGSETLVVYSIVNSLAANIHTVHRVKILVQGQEVETLDGHADLSGYLVLDSARMTPAP